MKMFASLILGITFCFSLNAVAGPGSTGGGGFMDYNGKKILKAAIKSLEPQVHRFGELRHLLGQLGQSTGVVLPPPFQL